MKIKYEGWELNDFDKANNFRNYQFSLINKYIKKRTAEIGPGTGQNIPKYIKKTTILNLFEPSLNLYKILKKKNKLSKVKIFQRELKKEKKKFDTIIYLDVLEHIKKDKIELIKALNNLKKGGYLIINVPAFNFLYSNFDRDVGHFKRYSKKDFKNMTSNMKFDRIVYMSYYDSLGFLLSFMAKLFNVNYRINFNKKILLWNTLIPLSKLIDKLTFNTFGKSLICIIKK